MWLCLHLYNQFHWFTVNEKSYCPLPSSHLKTVYENNLYEFLLYISSLRDGSTVNMTSMSCLHHAVESVVSCHGDALGVKNLYQIFMIV